MEAGRILGRAIAWPFTAGYSLIWGDPGLAAGESKESLMANKRAPRSLRQGWTASESSTDLPLSPTINQASLYRAGLSASQEDITSPYGTFFDDSSPNNIHSILSVPIPIEEETFPAYLAGLPDVAFPRYRLILPKKPKILVLDLDETLVHSTSASAVQCDFLVEVLVEHLSCLYYVHRRPYVEHFIDVVSSMCCVPFDLLKLNGR